MYYTDIMNMFIVSSIPFFVVSAFHLLSCLLGKTKWADRSKRILVPLLILAAVSYFFGFKYGQSSERTSLLQAFFVCLALCAGTAGDVLLIGDVKPKNVLKGLYAFLFGHFIYIFTLVVFLPFYLPPLPFVIAVSAAYGIVVFISWLAVGKPGGKTGTGVLVYASVLSLFSLLTLLMIMGSVSAGQTGYLKALVKIYAGTVLFLVSDSALSQTIFAKPFFQSRFIVMTTYLTAQFFIAWGFFSV